jgi:dUTP pyrophosphatase
MLSVRLLAPNAYVPTRSTPFAAGWDLYAPEDVVVPSRGKLLVFTNIAIAVPLGTYGRIASRSGMACNYHITIGAGVIDPDYRGNIGVLLFNHSADDYQIERGNRIAQMVLVSEPANKP